VAGENFFTSFLAFLKSWLLYKFRLGLEKVETISSKKDIKTVDVFLIGIQVKSCFSRK
jgi:hypothetical protein